MVGPRVGLGGLREEQVAVGLLGIGAVRRGIVRPDRAVVAPVRVGVIDVEAGILAVLSLALAQVPLAVDAPEPAVLGEYRELLPAGLPVEVVERMAFYELTRRPEDRQPTARHVADEE